MSICAKNTNGWVAIAAMVAVLSVLQLGAAADDGGWDALATVTKELSGCESDLRTCSEAIDIWREHGGNAAVTEAKRKVEDAEKTVVAATKEDGLDELHEKLRKAQAARDEKIETLLKDATDFQAATNRRDEVRKKIADQERNVAALKADDLLSLAQLRMEERHLTKQIHGAMRACWKRGEVLDAYKAADAAFKAYGEQSGKGAKLQEANGAVKAARKNLADAMAAVTPGDGVSGGLTARKSQLEAKIGELKSEIARMDEKLGLNGKTVNITEKKVNRKTGKEEDAKLSLWLPGSCSYVRGVIVAHPMIKNLAFARPIRISAAREGLGTLVYDGFSGDGRESLTRLDALLEKFAGESGHPELKGAPLIVGGLSASVLGTRNVACAVPERVFGVVHAAGGNMQEMPDDGRGMVNVPFLAMNGEFEWCGPAGGGHASGLGGIRPQYGNQTQWVMIREQMLRLWRDKHEHRMTLVVVPNADHGAWDVELTAMFVRKAAQYRLPKEKRDGSKPAVCLPLPADKGWLTDADLDHPKFEPSSSGSYAGDKNNVFWHFDEEMARAVYEYHRGKFLLPDPTKIRPIPPDWPKK